MKRLNWLFILTIIRSILARNNRRLRGFTLIEVLVSTTLASFVAISVSLISGYTYTCILESISDIKTRQAVHEFILDFNREVQSADSLTLVGTNGIEIKSVDSNTTVLYRFEENANSILFYEDEVKLFDLSYASITDSNGLVHIDLTLLGGSNLNVSSFKRRGDD